MRTQITFVVRLWVKPDQEVGDPEWLGQVECVSSGEQLRFRNWERLVAFLAAAGAEASRGSPDRNENGS
jgi:hypothetical protein